MSDSKYTPGPWHTGNPLFGLYHIYSDHTVNGQTCKSGRQAICTAPYEGKRGSGAYHEMFAANARLIAAAPDLLEALEEWIEDPFTNQVKARAAIAKATGSEK